MTEIAERVTKKFTNIDPLIFQKNHPGHFLTYGNRTFLLWRDLSDNSYMIKRLDGSKDYPSVKWDIQCAKSSCFRFFVDLKKDQENDPEKNQDIVIRILMYDFEQRELIIVDVSDFGSMVGEPKKINFAYNVESELWLIGKNLYFIADGRFYRSEILGDYSIQIISSQGIPVNLFKYIMTPDSSIFYIVKISNEKMELKYAPGADFFENVRSMKISWKFDFSVSSFSRYLILSQTSPTNSEYYYISQKTTQQVAQMLKKIYFGRSEGRMYHILENEATVSLYSSSTKYFYFYLKGSRQIFEKKIDIVKGHQLQGLIIDKTAKGSILNTRMVITYVFQGKPTELVFEKFDFTSSKMECLFLKANKETPDCLYRVITYKEKFDFMMNFSEFGEKKGLYIYLGSLVGTSLIIILCCRKICKKKKEKKMTIQQRDESYRMSLGVDFSKDQLTEFNIDYINEVYEKDSSDKRTVGDMYY